MSVYVAKFFELPLGGSLWVELDGENKSPTFFEKRRVDGELYLWIWKIHAIYTPRKINFKLNFKTHKAAQVIVNDFLL